MVQIGGLGACSRSVANARRNPSGRADAAGFQALEFPRPLRTSPPRARVEVYGAPPLEEDRPLGVDIEAVAEKLSMPAPAATRLHRRAASWSDRRGTHQPQTAAGRCGSKGAFHIAGSGGDRRDCRAFPAWACLWAPTTGELRLGAWGWCRRLERAGSAGPAPARGARAGHPASASSRAVRRRSRPRFDQDDCGDKPRWVRTTASAVRTVRAPRGTAISCKGWQQEAALRMLMNNLDPEVAERPEDLVVYGGTGKAARNWDCFDAIVARAARASRTTRRCSSSRASRSASSARTADAPRVLIANSHPRAEVGDLGRLPATSRRRASRCTAR